MTVTAPAAAAGKGRKGTDMDPRTIIRCRLGHSLAAAAVAILVLFGARGVALAGFDEGLAAVEAGDYAAALGEFTPLAEAGDSEAQYQLAILHKDGLGTARDDDEAARLYRMAADQELSAAQLGLGQMYAYGQGVDYDAVEAVVWYRRAAEQGLAEAQVLLGMSYAYGDGVVMDMVHAHKWLNLAAAAMPPGYQRDEAVDSRAMIEAELIPAQITEAQRLATNWHVRYAEEGIR